jgi:hypothetical protein
MNTVDVNTERRRTAEFHSTVETFMRTQMAMHCVYVVSEGAPIAECTPTVIFGALVRPLFLVHGQHVLFKVAWCCKCDAAFFLCAFEATQMFMDILNVTIELIQPLKLAFLAE